MLPQSEPGRLEEFGDVPEPKLGLAAWSTLSLKLISFER